jgi:phosphatidate cytidylyltransferase
MKRVLSALVLIPLVVWIVLGSPQWAFLTALAAISLISFYEFDSIAAAQGLSRSGILGMAAGLVLLLTPEPALPVLVAIGIVLMSIRLRLEDLTKWLPSTGASVFGLVYIFGAWRCAIGLREITSPWGPGPHWLMIALLVSWAGDTAAFYIGRAFGKHKLAPVVSPGKTWEGAVGSAFGGTLAAGVYAHFLIPPAPLAAVLATGAAANIAGQFGDLCESAFKRGAGVKDSGSTLPGHGGWLDRVDSSLFSIPVVYGILKLTLAYF